MVAVISVVPYLTIMDEHTMLYKVTKNVCIHKSAIIIHDNNSVFLTHHTHSHTHTHSLTFGRGEEGGLKQHGTEQ